MRLANISWFLSGLFLLLALTTSAMTVVPEAQWWQLILEIAFGTACLAFAGFAWLLSTVWQSHPIHDSAIANRCFLMFAILCSLLAFVSIG